MEELIADNQRKEEVLQLSRRVLGKALAKSEEYLTGDAEGKAA